MTTLSGRAIVILSETAPADQLSRRATRSNINTAKPTDAKQQNTPCLPIALAQPFGKLSAGFCPYFVQRSAGHKFDQG